MRLAWATDIHLDSAEQPAYRTFLDDVRATGADELVVTGDISTADRVEQDLLALARELDRPVRFVLGNHDYYGGSIAGVREGARRLSARDPRVCWLPAAGIVALSESTALVGHGGWGDGRLGDYAHSPVLLNDSLAIAELAAVLRDRGRSALDALEPEIAAARREILMRLGDEAARFLERVLPEAFEEHARVLLATHVPPFREACWYGGKPSNDDWLPHFSCAATGAVMRRAMEPRPGQELLVLCGHTHGSGDVDVLPNLRVLTGAAIYGHPQVQRTFEI